MQAQFAKWFPEFFGKGQAPRSLTLVSPLEEDNTLRIDGDALADMFPRKVVVGTTGIVYFKSPIRFVAGKGHNLDSTVMVVHHLDIPAGKKASANKVRLTGDVLISKDALQDGTDVFINEMTFVILSDGNIVFLPIPDVSEAKVTFSAPKPKLLK